MVRVVPELPNSVYLREDPRKSSSCILVTYIHIPNGSVSLLIERRHATDAVASKVKLRYLVKVLQPHRFLYSVLAGKVPDSQTLRLSDVADECKVMIKECCFIYQSSLTSPHLTVMVTAVVESSLLLVNVSLNFTCQYRQVIRYEYVSDRARHLFMWTVGRIRPTTHDPRPTTHDPRPTTHDPRPTIALLGSLRGKCEV